MLFWNNRLFTKGNHICLVIEFNRYSKNIHEVRELERERERETDRQTDRDTDRQTDRERQTDRQTDRERIITYEGCFCIKSF